jgi:hypothetical protein
VSPLEAALERLKIADVWRILALRGDPPERDKTVCSPFRDDKDPSLSIFNQGRKWKDHGTGESGNVVDFLAKARGLENGDACRELIRLAGTADCNFQPCSTFAAPTPPRPTKKLELPHSLKWDPEIAKRVADSRELHITSVEFAFLWLKTLRFCRVCNNQMCWLLSDASRRCAEARRIDGEMFPALGASLGERKSHSITGSDKSWPVGIIPPGFEEPWLKQHCHKLLLVEGGPDYLAACQIIVESPATDFDNVLPVAILGASNSIAVDVLHYFIGRQTTIVAHGDNEGRDASARWEEQITSAGGTAQVVYLNNGTDLNDAVAAGAAYSDISLE